VSQALQIAGAIAILAAFAGAQARIVSMRSWTYLWLNFLGAAALASSAAWNRQWGFLLLNSVWSAVAAVGLVARLRRTSLRVRG
jgi:hypothetical protein